MAYINAEFTHNEYDIVLSVLEPTKDESDYDEGMKIDVEWDSFLDLNIEQMRNVLKWMNEKVDYIEQNFTKRGKPKTIRIKG